MLVLGDSSSTILGALKGRSSANGLATSFRAIAAHCLAIDLLVRWRWIPSEVNPADGPSRGRPIDVKAHAVHRSGEDIGHPKKNNNAAVRIRGPFSTADFNHWPCRTRPTCQQLEDSNHHSSGPSRVEVVRERPRCFRTHRHVKLARQEEVKRCLTVLGTNPLNVNSVRPLTSEAYATAFEELRHWFAENGEEMPINSTMDERLCEWMLDAYAEGKMPALGSLTIAALAHFHPAFSLRQGSIQMPLARQALRGWYRLCPPLARLGWPEALIALVVLEMLLMPPSPAMSRRTIWETAICTWLTMGWGGVS